MSFILDALKKVDRDGRDGEAVRARRAFAISRARLFRQNLVWMAIIALASAGLTAGVVSTLVGRNEAASTIAARPTPDPAASSEPAEESSHAVTAVRPMDAARAPSVVEKEAVEPEPKAAPERRPDPDPEPAPMPEKASGTSTPAMRLVGRESAALAAVRADRAEAPGDEATREATQEAPRGAPELVLQGTSVIDGAAVAVISDERVFEGDFIDGAVVIRIGDREVELEFEGKRYTLRL